MKKLYIVTISVLIIMSIMAFPGCGGGGGNNPPPDAPRNTLKLYEVTGGTAYIMPSNLNKSGLVFADSLSEIGSEYVVFVGNYSESVIPTIQAYYYDNNGNKMNIPVAFAKDTSADDCFNMESPNDIAGGGSQFQLTGNSPGGRGKLIASANGQTKEVDIYVYNSFGSLNTGLNVVTRTQIPYTDVNSTIYGDTSSSPYYVRLNKRSYAVPDGICDGFTWKEKLKAIKTVNTSGFVSGSEDQALEGPECPQPQIFVAEAAGGGYIKMVKIGSSTIWEYTNTTSFK
jgi:hypothetical protein